MPGGHSNTSVVHMRNQWFSKHTKRDFPSPGKAHSKQEFPAIPPPPQFTTKQALLEDMFSRVRKMTPKRLLIESKRTPFLKNRHILTANRDSRVKS